MALIKLHRAFSIACTFAAAVFVQSSVAVAEPGVTTSFNPVPKVDPLVEAAAFGQANRIFELLATKHYVDAADADGNTALSVAAFRGHVAITKLLIEAGATVDLANSRRETPLALAARQGHTAIIRLLAPKSASLDRPTIAGMSPLALATLKCHDGAAAALLKAGANAGLKSGKERQTPLMIAAEHCDDKTISVLLEVPTARAPLVTARDSKGRTAIWHAASAGNIAAIPTLFSFGADANVADETGETPLHRAAAHETVVSLLIAKGAVATVKSHNGTTPLMRAAAIGTRTTVDALLKSGAAVDDRNKSGQTALMIAAASGRAEVVQRLLEAGANRSLRNVRRETANEIAAKHGHTEIATALR